MTNQNRKSVNRTRFNKRKSLRNNKKVGGANPTYLYLIYTEAPCSEGAYLFHIRYLGFNLKDTLQYYHSLFTQYVKLKEGHKSNIDRSYITYASGLSSIGRHYLDISDQSYWLQEEQNPYTTFELYTMLNLQERIRADAVKHLVDSKLSNSAYDSYLPMLVKLNISTGKIERDIFYHQDSVYDETIQAEDNLRVLVNDEGGAPQSTLDLIDNMDKITSTKVKLHFLKELGLFHSVSYQIRETVAFTRSIVNKRYPNAKELNSIEIVPTTKTPVEAVQILQILTDTDYTLTIPSVGLDVSQFNVVLSDGYFAITPEEDAHGSQFGAVMQWPDTVFETSATVQLLKVTNIPRSGPSAEEYNAQHPDSPSAYD